MKYYLLALLFALQLTLSQMQAMDIGTDPVGNVAENGEDEDDRAREQGREDHRQAERPRS